MNEFISYLQLSTNAFAIGVAGWIYIAYIKNIKASLTVKDDQIKLLEQNNRFQRDQISDLEKKSPENLERILNDRIKIREDEIERLAKDKNNHEKELQLKTQELTSLKSKLEKSRDLKRTMDLLDLRIDDNDSFFSKDAEYEIEELGLVAVDSGSLMITDPSYIDTEWNNEDLELLRLYKHKSTGNIYSFGKDFFNYENKIEGFDQTVNELIAIKELEEIPIDYSNKVSYSFAGACYATLSGKGYGVLPFKKGHQGAAIVVGTVLGDGFYPVYAEKYDGRIVRVYFNVY